MRNFGFYTFSSSKSAFETRKTSDCRVSTGNGQSVAVGIKQIIRNVHCSRNEILAWVNLMRSMSGSGNHRFGRKLTFNVPKCQSRSKWYYLICEVRHGNIWRYNNNCHLVRNNGQPSVQATFREVAIHSAPILSIRSFVFHFHSIADTDCHVYYIMIHSSVSLQIIMSYFGSYW